MSAIDPNPRFLINDSRWRAFRDRSRPIAFICECGDDACHRTVVLSPDVYEARRPGLILDPGHGGRGAPRPG